MPEIIIWKVLTNKYTWMGLAVVVSLIFFSYVQHLRSSNASLTQAVKSDTAAIKSLTNAQNIMQSDVQTMNDLLSKRQVIYVNQAKLNNKIATIPNTTTDLPFQDKNLMEAAKELRDYQTNSND